MKARFGIDFGGVIVRKRAQYRDEDTDLADHSKADVAIDGVFEAVREVVQICDGFVWIVSKAGPRMEARTRAWLAAVDFYSYTGLDPAHVRFCHERQEKKGVCRELKISHFIDDRIHVMQILRHTVPHLFLFGDQGAERFCPTWATFVSRWSEIPGLLTSSLDENRPQKP